MTASVVPIALSDDFRLAPLDPSAASADVVEVLLTIYSDPATVRMVDGPEAGPYDREKLLRMYRYLGERGELYLVEQRRGCDWEPVGDVALATTMIPIVLAPSVRGRGLGRLIRRASDLGWDTIRVSDIYEYNEASRALFTSLGFRQDAPTPHGHSYVLPLH